MWSSGVTAIKGFAARLRGLPRLDWSLRRPGTFRLIRSAVSVELEELRQTAFDVIECSPEARLSFLNSLGARSSEIDAYQAEPSRQARARMFARIWRKYLGGISAESFRSAALNARVNGYVSSRSSSSQKSDRAMMSR